MVEYTCLLKNYNLFKEEYEEAVLRVLNSGWYILGPELERFEKEFANYIGVKHCVGVNSGTDALILAIRALGIGKGDEVIVPAGTYIATVLGVTENGATPVYVDSTDDTYLINPEKIEAAISERTKAIIPVHLYGQACDMSSIIKIAYKYNIPIVEDCAQSHGSKWNGALTGTQSTISCFSFYPTKPLGAFGDAGCICTNDDYLAEKIRMLRNYGSKIKYVNESLGINSRLDEIQAAILSVGLSHIDETNNMRINISKKYLNNIKNSKIKLPYTDPSATNVFHLFPVLVDNQNSFREHMLKNGVKTQIHYPIPPFLADCYKGTEAYKQLNGVSDYTNAYYIATHEVSLPIYSGMKEEEIDIVIEAANNY